MSDNTSPAEVVARFISAWPEGNSANLASFFSDDAVYHNIPMEPIVGREAIEATFAAFMGMAERIEFETLHTAVDGSIVMTERIDRFISTAKTIVLPVMGTFEVVDGKIRAWRDYFDLAQFTTQISA
ncbi:MAG TPA: limonene-1,2-epoxide hydrolase family protein [Acidimicrobiales bacterium]|nr:limonene-1,2-epoxide hydrolase family protein [Acidimicrobiales bacterium]